MPSDQHKQNEELTNMKLRNTILATTLICATAPALGADFYMSAGLGSLAADNSSNEGVFLSNFTTGEVTGVSPPLVIPAGSPVGWNTDINGDSVWSMAAGWKFDNFRFEIEYINADSDIRSHQGVTAAGIDLTAIDAGVLLTGNVGDLGVSVGDLVADGRGDIETSTFFFNAIYDFRSESKFTPYVGFGLGYADTDINFSPSGVGVLNDSDSTFAYQGILGASYEINETLELFGNYRMWDGGEAKGVSGLLNASLEVDVSGSTFDMGIRYHFD
jgi:opacity protein-like surface antigen